LNHEFLNAVVPVASGSAHSKWT